MQENKLFETFSELTSLKNSDRMASVGGTAKKTIKCYTF